MDAAGTKWFAFKDPKTGREYFHEPISGDTSWVLPTSAAKATHLERTAGANGCRSAANRRVKTEKETNGAKRQGEGWSAVATAIVSILLFNTLFLLVLVRSLYATDGGGTQMPVKTKPPSEGILAPHEGIVKPTLATEMHTKVQGGASAKDEPESMANDRTSNGDARADESSTPEECPSKIEGPDASGAGKSDAADTPNMNPPEEMKDDSTQQTVGKANGECRLRVRARLPMPLVDAEKAVWI
ncbi:hypothetical protein ACHAXT_001001 [Thalassiosira profunda]